MAYGSFLINVVVFFLPTLHSPLFYKGWLCCLLFDSFRLCVIFNFQLTFVCLLLLFAGTQKPFLEKKSLIDDNNT